MTFIKKLLKQIKRGFFLFLFQCLLLSLILFISQTREWYLSVFLPLLGVGNMTLAWFLYLRNDGFLRATKKNYTPETMGEGPEGLFAPPPAKSKETAFVNPVNSGDNSSYQGAFFTAGIFFLAAATVMYLWGGVGSYYYTPKTFL